VDELLLTYIGGPTALLEWCGLRLLTDPTFDPAGTVYELPAYTLRKTQGPAIAAGDVGPIDAVLLSHDHHLDNLDVSGRALLAQVGAVLTTPEGAGRLEVDAIGLAPWAETRLTAPAGDSLLVTATPARHGPADWDRGPVTGFALAFEDEPGFVVYVSGDTVWFEGVSAVARRFDVRVAVLNLGAAEVGIAPAKRLTLSAGEGVQAAEAMAHAAVVPLHFEGWEHFSESRAEVEQAFASAALADRLCWPRPGEAIAPGSTGNRT
jgi:L-ascorbate metabolism protein UlaG (beta-lactamase superfamily)